MTQNILHIDASARTNDSLTRKMSLSIVRYLHGRQPASHIVERNVAKGVSFIDETWVSATFTAVDERSPIQKQALAESDVLVAELQQADTVVIGVPMYNFSLPASLKAWIDLVARAGVTFKYTEKGPVGLLKDKKVYLVMASGGVELGSQADFSTDYLKFVLGFMGLNDVSVINVNTFDFKQQHISEVV